MRYKVGILAVAAVALLWGSLPTHGEDIKEIARRALEEGINKGSLVTIDEIFSPTFLGHLPSAPPLRESEEVKHQIVLLRTAFPDVHYTVDDMLVEGDKVAMRFTLHGTQTGPYWGIAPTGKQVTITGINILRITDDNVQEGWVSVDALGLLQQLGALPVLGQAK